MTDAAEIEPVAPFESASELREQHAGLLDVLDRAIGHDASTADEAEAFGRIEPQVRAFLERAAATGMYLEDIKERTACQALLDYWVSSLAQVGMGSPATRLALFDGTRLPDLKDKPCPYVGLDAFHGKEFFFGRDADAKELVELVHASPLVVVLGASGSGKSSLVMGAVLPALGGSAPTSGFRIAPVIVPGNAVLEHLADSVVQVGGGARASVRAEAAKLLADPGHLAAMLGSDAPPTLLTIDQFEEVFTLADAATRDAVAIALAALLADHRHRAILTIREEFRTRLVELQPLVPYLDRAWYSMRPMGYEALKSAVEGPAKLVNLQFQGGIVDDLVKKVLGQPAALPLLQFTLRELWTRRDRNRITWEVYRQVGDPLNALKSSADVFYDGLAPQTQAEARRILLELVRVDELLEAYRQPVPKSVLLRAGKADTEEVLRLLVRNDYVRVTADEGGSDSVVEVKHESLIRNWPRLVGWIDEKRRERRQRLALTQTAQRWEASGKPRVGLLTGWQLEDATQQADLSELERGFVEASAEEVNRVRREQEETLRREAEQARAQAEQAQALTEQARALALRERRSRKRITIAFVVAVVTTVAALIGLVAVYLRAGALEQMQQLLRLAAETQKEQYTRLQDEYNELFAKQVSQAVAPASHLPSSQSVNIYILISDLSQGARADNIREQLVKNGIGVSQKIELVRDSPRVSQVRYFRAEDQRGAEEITKLLNKYLGVTQIETILVPGYKSIVGGRQYEIWFGRDAFAPATSARSSLQP